MLRVYWNTLKHINLRGYVYIWANVMWVLLSLPLITAPAAWAGLMHLSYKAHTTPNASLNDFWEGFRMHLGRGVIVGLLTAIILMINISNLIAYQDAVGWFPVLLRFFWWGTIIIWLSVQFYLWPLLEMMEQPTLFGGLRNALVMILRNPFFTLGLWPGILLVIGLSTVFFPAWLLLTGSVLAVLGTRATLDRLEVAGYTPLPL
ncbi:MAG: hypothetical protein OHK0046_46860 [Anaerolineae bacterium]